MRGEQFCYFHQRMIRGVRTPPQSRLHPIALIEDQESLQVALMEVINALMRNSIDLKRATLILRALHIAVRNVRYLKFGINDHKMVKDVPAYPAPPAPVHDSAHESVPAPAQWSANMTPAEVAAKIRADRAESSRFSSCRDSRPRLSKRPRSTGPHCSRHHNSCRDGRIRPSRRPRITGPQRTPLHRRTRIPTTKAATKCKPSSEGAKECSPRRKPWVAGRKINQAPKGRKK
jgi:hypothetical protein